MFIQKVSFQIFTAGGGAGWVGIADAIVEESALLECVLHTRVFLCVSCFLTLLPASLGPTHLLI